MDYFNHPKCNHSWGAPLNWDHSKVHCGSLPAHVHSQPSGPVSDSFWKPSADDMKVLAAGGHVVLRVYGGQPPVSLVVEPAP